MSEEAVADAVDEADEDAEASAAQPSSFSAAFAAIRYPDRKGGTWMSSAFSFAIWAMVSALASMTFLQAAALDLGTWEEAALAVGLDLKTPPALPEPETEAAAKVGLCRGGGEAPLVGADGGLPDGAEAERVPVGAALDATCGAARVVAAKRRMRDVGFMVRMCCGFWRSVG